MKISPNTKVLVIDDSITSRAINRGLLIKMGFARIFEAQDGDIAWELIQDHFDLGHPFHLIICDWNMPTVTGLDLLNLVRSDDRFEKIPFLMLTSENDPDSVHYAIKCGVSNYLLKPFSYKSFHEKISKL